MPPDVLNLLPVIKNFCIWILCNKTPAISSAASSPTSLFEISNSFSDDVVCNAFAILITPEVCNSLQLTNNFCRLAMQDKTATIPSALALPILLLDISKLIREEIFCKDLVILMVPAAPKLLLLT